MRTFTVWRCFTHFGHWPTIEFDPAVLALVSCHNRYAKAESFSALYRNIGMKVVGGRYRRLGLTGATGDNQC